MKSVGRIEQSEIRRNSSSAEGKSGNSGGREQKERLFSFTVVARRKGGGPLLNPRTMSDFALLYPTYQLSEIPMPEEKIRVFRIENGELVRIPGDVRDPKRRYAAAADLNGSYHREFTDEEEKQRDQEVAEWKAKEPEREAEKKTSGGRS